MEAELHISEELLRKLATKRCGHNARVLGHTIEAISVTDDDTTEIYRLAVEVDIKSAVSLLSFIVKRLNRDKMRTHWPSDERKSRVAEHKNEVFFLQRLSHLSTHIPTLYYYDVTQEAAFMEDLGREQLDRLLSGKASAYQSTILHMVLDTLVELQSLGNQVLCNLELIPHHCFSYTDRDGLAHIFKSSLDSLGTLVSNADISETRKLCELYQPIANYLHDQPKQFVYGACVLRNMCLTEDAQGNKKVKFFDFEHVTKGVPLLDLAMLLQERECCQSLTEKDALVQYYLQQKHEDVNSHLQTFHFLQIQYSIFKAGWIARDLSRQIDLETPVHPPVVWKKTYLERLFTDVLGILERYEGLAGLRVALSRYWARVLECLVIG